MRGFLIFLPALLIAQTPAPSAKSTGAAKSAAAAKPPATGAAAGMTDDQKTIYALGLSIYKSIAPFNLSPAELELVKKGMSDGAANKPALDLDVQGPKIQALVTARTKAASQAYLSKAALQPGAVKLPSGIIYREERAGTGPSPKATDTVRVNYRGTLTNGTEFDSSYRSNMPFVTPLTRVIPCWTEGVQKMKVGGKAMLTCPAELAYGDQGQQGIPPGSTLIFEIELLAVNPPATK
ncbi:MAG TPA: FKBP-type peptidyl-prolyl cis-trans isomerase [Bryobacteraceae bacterium]|jgi:FKBP-type peptidyl-prolyl cis-trans isomerase FkpA